MQVDARPDRDPNRLTLYIMVGLVLGIICGYACHALAPDAAAAKTIAGYFSVLSDVFLRLIKMVIAPLVFATIVSGITSLGASGGAVGRIAAKALGWFISASLVSLFVGSSSRMSCSRARSRPRGTGGGHNPNIQATGLTLKGFASHLVPSSIVEAMATNEVLQILVFSTFFGFSLAGLKGTVAGTIATAIDELVR